MTQLAAKLLPALRAIPTRGEWLKCSFELVWLVPVFALCIALSDEMYWHPVLDAATFRMAAFAVIVPSLGEELFFRAALLPRPTAGQKMPVLQTLVANILFILWHPLQAVFAENTRAVVFLDPFFLIAVAALGLACSRTYWRTGSLWPAITIHWLTVIGWKALAGGPALI